MNLGVGTDAVLSSYVAEGERVTKLDGFFRLMQAVNELDVLKLVKCEMAVVRSYIYLV